MALDLYRGSIPIFDPDNSGHDEFLRPADATFGLVPRDWNEYPQEMFGDPPAAAELIPESEDDARYDEQEAQKSSLEHLYLPDPNGPPAFTFREQNGLNYCWVYSVVNGVMMDRLKQGLPTLDLNPAGLGAILMKGANRGGWCGLSCRGAEEIGIPLGGGGPGRWPGHSLDLRTYDTAALRAAMAVHKVTASYRDLTRQDWDHKLTMRQLTTCGFLNIPCPTDYNWWGHSVLTLRRVRIERGSWGTLILNSWLRWGRHGLAVLRGNQGIPNGAIAIRASTASVA